MAPGTRSRRPARAARGTSWRGRLVLGDTGYARRRSGQGGTRGRQCSKILPNQHLNPFSTAPRSVPLSGVVFVGLAPSPAAIVETTPVTATSQIPEFLDPPRPDHPQHAGQRPLRRAPNHRSRRITFLWRAEPELPIMLTLKPL